jgi:hypothetical protein
MFALSYARAPPRRGCRTPTHQSVTRALLLDWYIKKTPWLVVRKRTIPTERPPLVSEASANFCG